MRPQNVRTYDDVLVALDNTISELERLDLRPGRLTQLRAPMRCLIDATANENLSGLARRFGRSASDGSPGDAAVVLNLGWRRISSVLAETYEIANIAFEFDTATLDTETLVHKWRDEQEIEERCRQAIGNRGLV
jgi:hypothetical protein